MRRPAAPLVVGLIGVAAIGAWTLSSALEPDADPAREPAAVAPPDAASPPAPEDELVEVDGEELGELWQRALIEALERVEAEGLKPEARSLKPASPTPTAPSTPPATEAQAARYPTPTQPPSPRGPRTVEEMLPPPPPPRAPFDESAVKQAVSAVKPGVKACFEQGMKQDRNLAGEVVLRFIVREQEGEGRITDAEYVEDQTTMADVLVQACILDAMSRARFPSPRGGEPVRVTFPFRFRRVRRDGGA